MNRKQWEKDYNITADRLREHHKYYMQLSKVLGIGWPDDKKEFMGKSLEYWKKQYKANKYLNSHPLKEFDAYHSDQAMLASSKGLGLSMSDTVCCLKAVIIDKVLKNS